MASYSIGTDAEGCIQVAGEAPSLLGMFLESIDREDCRRVIRALAEVREGKRAVYACRYDAVCLNVRPDGASFRIAANLMHNPDLPLTLPDLEEGLRRLEIALVARA